MKKFFTLIAFCLFASLLVQSQTPPQPPVIVTWSPLQPCANSPVYFTVTDTSGTWTPGYIDWYFGDGSTSQTLNPVKTYTAPGLYQGTLWIMDSLTQQFDTIFFAIFVDSTCGTADLVEGDVYNDANGNGAQDGGEGALYNVLVKITPGPFYLSTNLNGHYAVYLPAGSWTFSAVAPKYAVVTEPVSNSYSLTLTGTSQTFSGNDFGVNKLTGINDLMVTVMCAPPVAGFNRIFTVCYSNQGTDTMFSGSVNLTADANYAFLSADMGGTMGSGMVTWTYANLAPGEYRYVHATFKVSQSVTLGDTLCHFAQVNPVSGDTVPTNNMDTLCQVVVGSYDPNDKTAEPAGIGAAGEIPHGTSLEYRIRFQNTGTFYATNVILRDTLDADLDISTLHITYSSHPLNWYVFKDILTFEFMSIMLPDSNSDEPGSHGAVKFTIQPLTGLADGTEITNDASIYFDFNSPVLTNSTLNTLETPVSVSVSPDHSGLEVFPNPFSETAEFRFSSKQSGVWEFSLVDVCGREMRSINGISGNFNLEKGDLLPGIYFYNLQNLAGNTYSGKLVIQ